METYEEKYQFEVHDRLDVEIYPNPATFGVRSVGLPHISPTGLCFGRIVISRSPSAGNFNWRQVIWHEMAHVYHIQKAQYRVPRWFTEGLAEYETNVKNPAWSRHRDRAIVAVLRRNDLPSVVDLDKRFTQARSFKGILRAYQLSSLAIHFIVEKHGFDAINAMLEEFPRLLDTGEVIEAALGTKVEAFDENFKAWLKRRYSNFNHQFLVSVDAIEPIRVLNQKLSARPTDAALRAKFAVAKLQRGEVDAANRAIERALALDPDDPTVRYLAALVELHQGHTRDAYAHGLVVLDAFKDGYELRVMLGHAAMMLEKPTAAHVHLWAAVQLYEDGVEAWMNLLKLAESQQNAALEERAEARLFELDQNNPRIARRRFKRMMSQKDWAKAAQAAERWVAIEPLEPRSQRAMAEVSLRRRNADRAVDAYEVLLRLLPDEKAKVVREASAALGEAGFEREAQRFLEYTAKK
jgi:tetratricopeptide (TPR) repeat protein